VFCISLASLCFAFFTHTELLSLTDIGSLAITRRYAQQPTGIAPERVKQMKMDLTMTDTREYILRPEAMESFWYMHQITGDPKYREWGWTIFRNFVRSSDQLEWVLTGRLWA
jgi:hypothetical protein